MEENRLMMKFNVSGEERKRLAKAAADFVEEQLEYLGAPDFLYRAGDLLIDREGTVTFGEDPDLEEAAELKRYLEHKGFHDSLNMPLEPAEEDGEPEEETAEEPEENTETPELIVAEAPLQEDTIVADTAETEEDATQEETAVTIEMPLEGFTEESLSNLRKIIDSRASLLKKSLGTDDLSIEVTEDRIRFPWFHGTDSMKTAAYTHLVSGMCEMAKKVKRVTASDHPVESEKYAFRTWLLRLGFKGPEYRNDREVLMENLSGYAAFKNDAQAEAFFEKHRAKKAADSESAEQIHAAE